MVTCQAPQVGARLGAAEAGSREDRVLTKKGSSRRKEKHCHDPRHHHARGSTTDVHQGFPRHSISSERCRALGGVLYAAPRVHAEASAAPRVCERLPWRRADLAQRSRRIGLETDAKRATAAAGWVESGGPEGCGTSKLHR